MSGKNSDAVSRGEDASASTFSLKIEAFPSSLQPVLRKIDDEGNGLLEIDEITEVFQMCVVWRCTRGGSEILCAAGALSAQLPTHERRRCSHVFSISSGTPT